MQTNVLYVSVPVNMEGGRLRLYEHKRCLALDKIGDGEPLCADSSPSMTVMPVENTMVQFRGDAFHGVETYKAQGNRVSLVLEQYKIPRAYQEYLVKFKLRRHDGI